MKKCPRGAEASTKASIIAYVAHTTWTSLFLAALAHSNGEENDQEATWPADETKTKVLRRLLPLVVPERTDDPERLQIAVELCQDSSRFGSLLTKLHSAIQVLMKVDDFVVRTLETASEEAA